jgi:uncharacterized protein
MNAISTTQRPNNPFHVMVKPSGARCNLDCAYCYFLSKEKMYPQSRFRMDDTILENFIRQYIESQDTPEVTFSWQGGEPTLMGLEFFKRAVHLQQKYAKPRTRIINTVQTNGILLDEAFCRFFKQYGFLIGISIDGPKEIHNAYRVTKRGTGSFSRVMQGLELLKSVGVEYNILCSVHAANQDSPLAVYRFFRDKLNARFIQFIPIVERSTPEMLSQANAGWRSKKGQKRRLYTQIGHKVTNRSVTAEKYGSFLIDTFNEWVRRDVGRTFVQIFDVALGAWLGQPNGLCIFSPTCGTAMALEHNGDLFSCDHYVEPDYFLGNIQDAHLVDVVSTEKQKRFGEMKRTALPGYCRRCDVNFACNGGCPKNRFIQTPDGESGLNYLCSGYKAFFKRIDKPMRTMADLLRQQRPPSDIMKVPPSN